MGQDLNEQDIEDLKEIRMLEKIASIKESQGLEDEHSDFIKDSQNVVDEALNIKNTRKPKVPYSSTKETLNTLQLDLDEQDRPITLTKTDFIRVYQIPNTNSIKVDLLLPDYEAHGQ